MKFNRFFAGDATDKRCSGGPFLELWIRKQAIAEQAPAASPVGGSRLFVRPGVRIGEHNSCCRAAHFLGYEAFRLGAHQPDEAISARTIGDTLQAFLKQALKPVSGAVQAELLHRIGPS